MRTLYNLLIQFATFILRILALFNTKLKVFIDGRKDVFTILKSKISANDKTIWFHCASLGEYEQGLPIMEAVKNKYSGHKIIVSFFSPSGYEIRKNTPVADAVVYLPMDTKSNAQEFIKAINPSLVIFIKYEFWPNYLFELQKKNIPTLLISALFRKDQVFFKSYGSFMRKALKTFDHIFVQNEESITLLKNIDIENVTLSGDTRFDRVSNQLKQENDLDFAATFKGNSVCIVCGSTWTEDENVLIDYINNASEDIKFIIAPHKIEPDKIRSLISKLQTKTLLYSELKEAQPEAQVLIIDTIGLLTKLYSYADIAYVGGAMGDTGLHNILEPATFGVPIIIGKNHEEFPEAEKLRNLSGLFVVENPKDCKKILNKLVDDVEFRIETGKNASKFVTDNIGATRIITEYITNIKLN